MRALKTDRRQRFGCRLLLFPIVLVAALSASSSDQATSSDSAADSAAAAAAPGDQQAAPKDPFNRDSLAARPASCAGLNFVGRAEWGAREPVLGGAGETKSDHETSLRRFAAKPARVFLHQTWDEEQSCDSLAECAKRLQAIQLNHQLNKRLPDVRYNALIAADGSIYEGIGLARQAFHTRNYNANSLGIALIGTFQDSQPSRQMEVALERLLGCLVDLGHLERSFSLHGHRDAGCTVCPGRTVYHWLKTMRNFRPGPLPNYHCRPPTMDLSGPVARWRRAATLAERPQLDGRRPGRHFWSPARAAIGKSAEKQIILIRVPAARAQDDDNQSSSGAGASQPLLYLITSSKATKPAALLIAPGLQQHQLRQQNDQSADDDNRRAGESGAASRVGNQGRATGSTGASRGSAAGGAGATRQQAGGVVGGGRGSGAGGSSGAGEGGRGSGSAGAGAGGGQSDVSNGDRDDN